jgi:hypothetical protein
MGVREMRAGDEVPATGKIKRSARHHGSNYAQRIARQYHKVKYFAVYGRK